MRRTIAAISILVAFLILEPAFQADAATHNVVVQTSRVNGLSTHF